MFFSRKRRLSGKRLSSTNPTDSLNFWWILKWKHFKRKTHLCHRNGDNQIDNLRLQVCSFNNIYEGHSLAEPESDICRHQNPFNYSRTHASHLTRHHGHQSDTVNLVFIIQNVIFATTLRYGRDDKQLRLCHCLAIHRTKMLFLNAVLEIRSTEPVPTRLCHEFDDAKKSYFQANRLNNKIKPIYIFNGNFEKNVEPIRRIYFRWKSFTLFYQTC